jgi:hypothetical protein
MGQSRRDLEKEMFWRNHIEEWRSSNTSIVEYCKNNGIKAVTFSWWKREILIRDCEKVRMHTPEDVVKACMIPDFAEVKVVHQSPVSPVECCPERHGYSGLEVVVSGNRRIGVYRGFDASVLVQLLEVLEHTPC